MARVPQYVPLAESNPMRIPVVEVAVNNGPNLGNWSSSNLIPTNIYVALFPTGELQTDGEEATGLAGLWNHIEACMLTRISPEYQHCQFIFQWIRPNVDQFSTFTTTKITNSSFLASTYQREQWKCYRLHLTSETRAALYRWCCRHTNVQFNTKAYYWNFLPCVPRGCAIDRKGQAFFCAEQVSTALRDIGLPEFSDIAPHTSTPDDIGHRLQAMTAPSPSMALTDRTTTSLTELWLIFKSSQNGPVVLDNQTARPLNPPVIPLTPLEDADEPTTSMGRFGGGGGNSHPRVPHLTPEALAVRRGIKDDAAHTSTGRETNLPATYERVGAMGGINPYAVRPQPTSNGTTIHQQLGFTIL